MTPEEYFFAYRFAENGVLEDGTPLREHLRRRMAICAFIEAGETLSFEVDTHPGFLWFTNGPALMLLDESRSEEARRFAFRYTGTRSAGYRADIAAGPVHVDFTNATDERYALYVANFVGEPEWEMTRSSPARTFFTNQTFLDLFEAETIVAAEGLAVKRLALLFTDIQGSTALYDRIGDMKAFDLVRQHFG